MRDRTLCQESSTGYPPMLCDDVCNTNKSSLAFFCKMGAAHYTCSSIVALYLQQSRTQQFPNCPTYPIGPSGALSNATKNFLHLLTVIKLIVLVRYALLRSSLESRRSSSEIQERARERWNWSTRFLSVLLGEFLKEDPPPAFYGLKKSYCVIIETKGGTTQKGVQHCLYTNANCYL